MMEAYQRMQEKKKAVLIQETIEKRKQQQKRLERLSEALEHVPPHQTGMIDTHTLSHTLVLSLRSDTRHISVMVVESSLFQHLLPF